MPAPPPRLRALLALPALAALLAGLASGLARLGIALPLAPDHLVAGHGALMTGGFFGTLIGLERAVASQRSWPYLAPLLSGLGALALLFRLPAPAAPLLMSGAALSLTLVSFGMWRQQREAHLAALAIAALAWLLGNAVWAAYGFVPPATLPWASFLVLTIAGERLELSRFVPTPLLARRVFVVIEIVLVASALAASLHAGVQPLFAAALLALALWLMRHDVARRTVRIRGLTRYMALCLLSGYAWLAAAAMLGLVGGFGVGHSLRDAALHALLLGFVFAMVFGHAPVIVPALTRLKMSWHRGFYLPLVALHLSLAWRIGAGLTGDFVARAQAGTANAIVVIVFLLMVAASLLTPRLKPPSR